ncbi:MAG: hypothetical protein CVV49_04120 [Spirochaetae bacterium HGW-Spirochaetae-5]|nr:MAG: hypothetical protein CVV49_04120 [Spirochaetae bacterium HGW-Spirochaetae-5]
MNVLNIMNQLRTVSLSIISNNVVVLIIVGVVGYALRVCIKEVWLTPLHEYKAIRKKVSYTLTMLASYYLNPIDFKGSTPEQIQPYRDAAIEMRAVASELRSFSEKKSWLRFGIPANNDIYEASKLLVGLSNSFFTAYGKGDCDTDRIERNQKIIPKVRELLKLHLYEE